MLKWKMTEKRGKFLRQWWMNNTGIFMWFFWWCLYYRPHIICQSDSHLWGHQHPLVKNELALFNFKVLASWCFCKCGISMDFTRFFYWTYQSFEEWLSFFSSNILWSLFLIFMTEKNFLLPRIKYTLKASNAFVDCHNEQ